MLFHFTYSLLLRHDIIISLHYYYCHYYYYRHYYHYFQRRCLPRPAPMPHTHYFYYFPFIIIYYYYFSPLAAATPDDYCFWERYAAFMLSAEHVAAIFLCYIRFHVSFPHSRLLLPCFSLFHLFLCPFSFYHIHAIFLYDIAAALHVFRHCRCDDIHDAIILTTILSLRFSAYRFVITCHLLYDILSPVIRGYYWVTYATRDISTRYVWDECQRVTYIFEQWYKKRRHFAT